MLDIKSVNRLSNGSKHCAFTDLTRINGHLLCAYREAENHISDDGVVVTCLLNSRSERQYCRLRLPGWDLRDPKFVVDNDGTLFLTAFARPTNEHTLVLGTRMVRWSTQNGKSWSSHHFFGPAHWWLWRFRKLNNQVWSLAYNRGHQRIDLYCGSINGAIECRKSGILSLSKHKLGYPNESDLWMDENNTMWALVRRDADSYSAQLGQAKWPYTTWKWQDLREYIGGPVWVHLTNDTMLVAGREWTGSSLATTLWTLTLSSSRLDKIVTLPSGGDNSYPGLILEGDKLWMTYYSSHIDNKSRVYIAELTGLNDLAKRSH